MIAGNVATPSATQVPAAANEGDAGGEVAAGIGAATPPRVRASGNPWGEPVCSLTGRLPLHRPDVSSPLGWPVVNTR